MRGFLRKTSVGRESLAVAMAGVRLGERVLQIGEGEPQVAGALAAKVGLSGHAAAVVRDEHEAVRMRRGAERSGALLETRLAEFSALPFEAAAFDAVILHDVLGTWSSLGDDARRAAAGECYRVLRDGGRAIVIERGSPTGLRAILRRESSRNSPADTASVATPLERAGFGRVRLLADRDGYRFFEGVKR